jgi:DNA-binding MarR family transcriptional regulator
VSPSGGGRDAARRRRGRAGNGRWDHAERVEQATNLLGALALAITDRMVAAITERGQSVSDATAMSALDHFLDWPTVDQLAGVLGLTSSGTVRLVDRLEKAHLVTRYGDTDGRATVVGLTEAGHRRAAKVTRGRFDVLGQAIGALTPDEQEEFGRLAGKVLAGMIRPPGARRWTCRLCDTGACGRPGGRCPVAQAAERRYGS